MSPEAHIYESLHQLQCKSCGETYMSGNLHTCKGIPDSIKLKHLNDAGEQFTKQDSTKIRLELIEPIFIEGIGKILTFGASKYQPNNWKLATSDDIERLKGSLLRHVMSYLKGEQLDPETNESHLYHIGCNIMFLDYFDRHKIESLYA